MDEVNDTHTSNLEQEGRTVGSNISYTKSNALASFCSHGILNFLPLIIAFSRESAVSGLEPACYLKVLVYKCNFMVLKINIYW